MGRKPAPAKPNSKPNSDEAKATADGPAQPARPTRAPISLNAKNQKTFDEIRDRLDQLAKRHQVIAWIIMGLTLVSVVAAILLIKYAGAFLGSDLQTARLNEPLVQDIEKQRVATEAKLDSKKKRTVAIKQIRRDVRGWSSLVSRADHGGIRLPRDMG